MDNRRVATLSAFPIGPAHFQAAVTCLTLSRYINSIFNHSNKRGGAKMDSRANAKEFVVRLHEVAEAAETGSPMPSETGQLHTFLTSESLSMVPLVQAHLAESALATPASATAGLGVIPVSL